MKEVDVLVLPVGLRIAAPLQCNSRCFQPCRLCASWQMSISFLYSYRMLRVLYEAAASRPALFLKDRCLDLPGILPFGNQHRFAFF